MFATRSRNGLRGVSKQANVGRRSLAAVIAIALAALGLVATPVATMAAPNEGIVLDQVTISNGSGPGGQLILGDTIDISGSWNASDADPVVGDTFMIGVPPELRIPVDVPFNLTGARPDGEIVPWANCLASNATNEVVCTLTDEVTAFPALVLGEFSFESEVVALTTEETLQFNLNGTETPVDLPGSGGIGDGIVISDDWTKAGEMNSNNWSMTWTIELPGPRMAGHDVINIADTLGAGHALCDPSGLTVETVRGSNVTDVTDIAEVVPGANPQEFTIQLTAPAANGFDSDVTYRITYQTCTPDGHIDPPNTEYTNEAVVDVWGESSGVIGVGSHPWQESLVKSGSVLGGADRNGKIAWTVTVPGDQLVGESGFTFTDTLGSGHEVGTDTISGITVTERYGPSNQLQRNVTPLLTSTTHSSSPSGFDVEFTISNPDFVFQASDYRYIITYETYVTSEVLPDANGSYSNSVDVNGEVAETDANVPGRTAGKTGSINTSSVTIDGIDHLPQTTLNWTITVPGERIEDVTGALTVTDTFTGAHQLCVAGDPGAGIASQLALSVQARDQITNGGLDPVDLTDSVVVAHEDGDLELTIPAPTLTQPDGSSATGFSREYQYVISYTTCTTSGGMDAPGTEYGNAALIEGVEYAGSTTQSNSGSGTGQGVPSGSVSVSKDLANTPGAQFVPDDATFTIRVQEFDPNGTEVTSYVLAVPLNDDPVSGLNPRGNGWTVVVSEPTFPSIPGVTFGAPVFAPVIEDDPSVTVAPGGTSATVELTPGSNISVGVTNEAQLGSLSLVKELEGGAADQVQPSQTYDVTAAIDTAGLGSNVPAQADRTFTLVAGEPVELNDLPIGATVTFSEVVPADDDTFTWGDPVFSPENLTVTAAHASTPATVTVTNSVERTVGTFSIEKTVTGEQAANPAVPDNVTVTATWDEEGTPGGTTLTVPTDGTPVPLGENLLIGTEVTLTETPLVDGSSIAWSAPIWSGTGVGINGDTAVVTIGRDSQATVGLENHAATSVAGISLLKGLAGEAAGEVDPATEFPVTATWTNADGVEQSQELTINALEPTPLGHELEAGTVVTITEGVQPGIDTVIWDSITITGDDVTDNGDGSAELIVSDQQDDMTLVTVTNEATWAPGTFSLSKTVTGVLLDNPDVPEAVDVIATWFEADEPVTTTISVPTDGEVVPFGANLPHGTEVTLSEDPLPAGTAFTWDDPTWDAEGAVINDDGSVTITIAAATDNAVNLTNNATALLGSLSITKSLAGEAASAVPSGTVFPVTATWTDLMGEEQQTQVEVTAGQSVVLDGLPLGTEVTLVEGASELPTTVEWLGAHWSVAGNGEEPEGETLVITVIGEAGTQAAVELVNEFANAEILAITGNTLAIGAAIASVTLLIGTGLALVLIRRRRI